MDDTLQPNFVIGNMADDLVSLTVELCGKKEDKHPRFPRYTYDSYVTRIIDTAMSIQENVFIANTYFRGEADRERRMLEASGKCVLLNHLIRISYDKGWISDRQRERWSSLNTNLHWKIRNWIKH